MAVFPQFLTAGDFGMSTSATALAITSGKYNEVGRKTTGAQQILNWGVGVVNGSTDTRESGRLRVDSTAGQITGKWRLAVTDANAENVIPVFENNDANFAATAGVKIGLSQPGAKEDSALLILMKPDTTTTIQFTDTDTTVNLPVTVTTGTR